MKLISTILLWAMIATGLHAQELALRRGKIITLQNDTLDVMLYHKDITNYKKCTYDKDGTVAVFLPSEIKGYYFDEGEHYVAKEVPINDKEYQMYFVEYLVEGVKNLYFSRVKGAFQYYIDYDETKLVNLHHGKKEVEIDGVTYFKNDNRIKTSLLYYFDDASVSVQNKINAISTTPSTNNLIKITKQYHDENCGENACTVYRKEKRKIHLSIAPFYGMTYMRDNATSFTSYGALLYLWLPKASEHLYLRTGFQRRSLEQVPENGSVGTLHEYTTIPFQFEYRFLKGRFQPRLNFGTNWHFGDAGNGVGLTIAGGAGFNVNVHKKVSLFAELQTDIVSLVWWDNVDPFFTYSPLAGVQISF
ncbi:hypothetical protein [Flammeovirga sp. EKP202]|uniref:hypothetical protein n=1 Tax=Flammeovirga sp. EKP202 TaxID=2770592 RepID=UPI00165F9E0C|nr:hypothetical protein [Flammeovirga sp. EKP202]MBD0400455.1 hypothetical protein [Flammeovirga sp. EKP202]